MSDWKYVFEKTSAVRRLNNRSYDKEVWKNIIVLATCCDGSQKA